ncbi:phosphate signaling complex protein PhoU [Natronobacterium gregoryi]|uniref:Phosphate-specific transport system accessory protein PhoU n=2 Tax=Natronobacterium gregoryi TaxID=44930 RepID=L0AJK7_NATGS|nr:phosphate signaling complex protein PhoU [Natronobacterium gregoryi]AFZ73604.1 phosphate transport system regulatory protein PhoU [Natronobacterium gregoryi SP2]ELY67884.1 phosphate uptake regulator PhoU [Natronobacterium gregoryi SP2]PLK20009.1 phosphate transport system regulatory protein PhoU [Natronobacterium gregoryi SP2]SFJ34525.1 phosphate uptake regulator, PhoU [Natronobacterium gregoryi]
MAREHYRQELETLREAVLEMGKLVQTQFDRAVAAFADHDPEMVRRVIESEDRVNERYLAIERKCIELLGLQQPVASDLRFVAAAFKISTDLERIGDIAVKIAERTEAGLPAIETAVDIPSMGQESATMVADAVDAFEALDTDACREIVARDDQIDQLAKHASRQVFGDMVALDTETVDLEEYHESIFRLVITVTDIEQVADHATNVAARTVYMATGDDSLLE